MSSDTTLIHGHDADGARIRLYVGLVVTSLLFLGIELGIVELELNGFLLFSLYFYLYAGGYLLYLRYRHSNRFSRILTNLFDSFSATVTVYVSGGPQSPMLLLYFWLMAANGARFGREFLIIATVVALSCYHLLALWAGYWAEHAFALAAQTIFYLILPLYFDMLLRKLQQSMYAAQASERAKSAFLANMTHELRTPLVGVIGTTQLLKRTPLTAEQAEYVATQEKSAEILISLIDDVLDYSKLEANHVKIESIPFNLQQVVEDVISIQRQAARDKGLELSHRFDAESDLWLVGDALRLKQVLFNLVGNAIKYTPVGRVLLQVRAEALPESKVALRIAVSDTGPGLDEGQKQQIFESFWQADDSAGKRHSGVGLGAAIAKGIIEAMGGNILVESTPGRGSTFTIELTLPQVGAPQGTVVAEEASATAVQRPLSILLVEDDPINQLVQRRLLESYGHRVEVAVDGHAALACQQQGYDMVLMDMRMPGMDGLETTRRWRQVELEQGASRTPIIALTANVGEEETQRCLQAGMDDVLTKPIIAARLDEIIEERLGSAA